MHRGTRLCPGARTVDLSLALFAICFRCAPESVSVWLVTQRYRLGMVAMGPAWARKNSVVLAINAGVQLCDHMAPRSQTLLSIYLLARRNRRKMCLTIANTRAVLVLKMPALSHYKCLGTYMKSSSDMALLDPLFNIYIYIYI